VCTSAWTCIASAPRSPSWMPPAPNSATATFPMIRPSWCRSWAPSRPGPRWRSRPLTAGAGWSSCWRSWSWNRTWSIPAAARPSPRPGCRNDKVDAGLAASPGRPGAAVDLLQEPGAAALADRGIWDHSSLWTGPGRAWLADLELPATPRGIIQDCCGLLDALATPIARLDRQIAGLANSDPRVQALMALPGIGKLTAMTLVARSATSAGSPPPASCAPGPG
jgi:hypothetical protein